MGTTKTSESIRDLNAEEVTALEGVQAEITKLLQYLDSTFAFEVKGKNYFITAGDKVVEKVSETVEAFFEQEDQQNIGVQILSHFNHNHAELRRLARNDLQEQLTELLKGSSLVTANQRIALEALDGARGDLRGYSPAKA